MDEQHRALPRIEVLAVALLYSTGGAAVKADSIYFLASGGIPLWRCRASAGAPHPLQIPRWATRSDTLPELFGR